LVTLKYGLLFFRGDLILVYDYGNLYGMECGEVERTVLYCTWLPHYFPSPRADRCIGRKRDAGEYNAALPRLGC
jgi:hypothetical protein